MSTIANIEVNGTELTATFANGTVHSIDAASLTPEVQSALMMHGLSQKVRDSYSGFGKKYGDQAADYAEATAQRVMDALKEGNLTVARQGGGGGARISVWVEALAQVKGIDVNEAAEIYGNLSKEQKAAVRGHSAVKAAKVQIEAARVEGNADEDDDAALDSLLEG